MATAQKKASAPSKKAARKAPAKKVAARKKVAAKKAAPGKKAAVKPDSNYTFSGIEDAIASAQKMLLDSEKALVKVEKSVRKGHSVGSDRR